MASSKTPLPLVCDSSERARDQLGVPEVPGQASDVCARRVRVRDRSLVGFVGVEGLTGDVGVEVTIGHSSDVGLDRTNNAKRTILQIAVMGQRQQEDAGVEVPVSGRRKPAAAAVNPSTESGAREVEERRRCSALKAFTPAVRTVWVSRVADGRTSVAWSCK